MSRTRYRYGPHRWQRADRWRPRGADEIELPVVVLVHGGSWGGLYSKQLMNRLSRSVVAEGWMAWNIDYRRLGRFGAGGGWPLTFIDVGAAIDYLVELPGIDRSRVVALGHSAGGHLACWAAARRRAPDGAPGTPPLVELRGVIALAGLLDFRHALARGVGTKVLPELLGGLPDAVPERYHAASPAELLPLGVPQVLLHGLEDRTIPSSLSKDYAELARSRGDVAVFEELPGLNHRQLIDPRRAAWPVARRHLYELLA